MSETGATREQIEQAILLSGAHCGDAKQYVRRRVKGWAALLVPPDHRIIGPDVLSAIAAVVQRERVDRALIGPSLSDEQLAALEAVLTPELRDQVEMWVREQL